VSEQQATPGTSIPRQDNPNSEQGKTIDIEKLAEKVYQLMCEEARMDRARRQKRPSERRGYGN
jgi:hypothetical protein